MDGLDASGTIKDLTTSANGSFGRKHKDSIDAKNITLLIINSNMKESVFENDGRRYV